MRWLGVLLGMTVIGCASEPSTFNCPQMHEFTVLEEKVLADELTKAGPTVQAAVEDYFKLRSACNSSTPMRGSLY